MATIKGKWIFEDMIFVGVGSSPITYYVNFTSNGTSFSGMKRNRSAASGRSMSLSYLYATDPTQYKTVASGLTSATFKTESKSYRIIDFGNTEQTVSDSFYNWFISEAIPYDLDTKTVCLRKNGAWVKQTAYERQNGEWVQISTASSQAFYNNVLLPTIPSFKEEPYVIMLQGISNGVYSIFYSTNPWYFYSTDAYPSTVNNDGDNCDSFKLTSIGWSVNKLGANDYILLGSNNIIVWSNHDIHKGSATATDIYFKGTEPIPAV